MDFGRNLTQTASGTLDFTCCDIEPAVIGMTQKSRPATNTDKHIARNIFLLTLLTDEDCDLDNDSIWDSYYHFYVQPQCIQFIRSHASKLLAAASSWEHWQKSKYGTQFKFCDVTTFDKVQRVWRTYILEGNDAEDYQKRLKDLIRLAQERHMAFFGEGRTSATASRSAAPLGVYALLESSKLFHHYWKYGTTEQDPALIHRATDANPLFAPAPDSTSLVHYGVDPLPGFHLALGLAILTPTGNDTHKLAFEGSGLFETAKAEFKQWCCAFRDHSRRSRPGCTLRFFIGDALAFCLSLGNILDPERLGSKGLSTSFPVAPLPVLDEAYFSTASPPVQFDVIDTSNLADHLGLLNILTSANGLLKPIPTSTL